MVKGHNGGVDLRELDLREVDLRKEVVVAEEKTYLELSEDEGTSHKFYEVTVKDTEVTIRYGRIGTDGQSSTKTYPTEEKAQAEAQKKIKQKLKGGYEAAVMGVRKKRAITRRQISSGRSSSKQAPVLWRFKSGAPAFGIFIDAEHCWVGNENGSIFMLNHNAEVQNQYRLADGVKCIVSDGAWLYAGCDDGNVYDLTGKLPRIAYEIAEDVDIYWLDIYDALLGVSDADGNILIVNHEDEGLSKRKSPGNSGWMVRCDAHRVYHGHSEGVTVYYGWEDPTMTWEHKTWERETKGAVLFGWQEKDKVYAGTSANKVYAIDKKEGDVQQIYNCDAAVFSCAAAPDGKYVFAGDNYSSIYCFAESGERLWKLATGCGSAYSMQYLNERLYIVTTDGSLTCIDASEAAIEAAKQGVVPEVRDIKAPKPVAVAESARLETTSDSSQGVIVKCIKEGGTLRVRVVSDGYQKDWNVQFPKNLRQENAMYIVDEVKESSRGGFYRAYGDIRRLLN